MIVSRRERALRALPFAAVALAGQLSVGWPPGPSSVGAYVASCVLLAVSACVMFGRRQPVPTTWVIRAAVYLASVALLMMSAGGMSTGLGSLLLVPVVGVALYGRRWESAAVVVAAVAALLAVSMASGPAAAAVTLRRVVLFGALGAMISLSIQVLRARLAASSEQTMRLLHQAEAVNAAALRLTTLLHPDTIIAHGTELAARIASPPGSSSRRAVFFRNQDGVVVIAAQFDESGQEVHLSWPLDEHPQLRRAFESGTPVSGPVDLSQLGPTLAEVVRTTGVTHAAWVPVVAQGSVVGVLAIASRGVPVPDDCVTSCVALAHLMELAIANWTAHQMLQDQAAAEERRRIARDLHDGLAHELAYIASKTHGSGGRLSTIVDAGDIAGAAERALDEARRAISVLSAAQPEPLSRSLAQAAEDLEDRHGVAVQLDLHEEIELEGSVGEHLLRIAREAITNAATHGAPRRITVRLVDADGIRLSVHDDGRGFDRARLGSDAGFGLVSMEERATAIGASFQLESAPGRGTHVEVSLP